MANPDVRPLEATTHAAESPGERDYGIHPDPAFMENDEAGLFSNVKASYSGFR